ncbi:MAG: peptidylprolyl isomerase [Corynebacterium sp.]|nr:peptidylprolyl isomerase [Corynebacterium sp.]
MSSNSNQERRKEAMNKLSSELKARKRAEKAKPLSIVAGVLIPIVVICGLIYWAVHPHHQDTTDTAADDTTATSTADTNYQPIKTSRDTPLADTVTCTYTDAGTAAKAVDKPQTDNVSTQGKVTVTLHTNQGDIPMELDRSLSPCTVNAITHLAQAGYYNDTVCHRLTTSGIYVLQCGDPSGNGTGGPGFQFANEFPTDSYSDTTTPVLYTRGTIAMANSGQDTNGSQFFLNYQDSPLPPNYTYFGNITDDGLQVLDKIAANGVANGASDGAPAQEVRIESATVES